MRMILAAAAATLLLTPAAGCGQSDSDPGEATSDSPEASVSSTSTESATTGVSYFESAVTPDTKVTPGTALTVEATGATPTTSYYCLLAVYSTEEEGVSAALKSSLQAVDSDAKGAISCGLTYQPFSAKDTSGEKRSCPTTAADESAGFVCGVVLADAATLGAVSASAVSFTTKD